MTHNQQQSDHNRQQRVKTIQQDIMSFEGAGKIPEAAWAAARLINLRRQLGISQQDLARRIHVRINTLKLWESGRGRATAWAVPSLNKLEKRLGKSAEMLAARKKGALIPVNLAKPRSRRAMTRRQKAFRKKRLRLEKQLAAAPLGSPMLLTSTADRQAQERIAMMKRLIKAAA